MPISESEVAESIEWLREVVADNTATEEQNMDIELNDQELRQILRSLNSVSHEHYVASERTANAARKAEQVQISGMYSRLADKIKQALG